MIADSGYLYVSAFNRATHSFLAMYNSKGELLKTFGNFFDRLVNKLPYSRQIYSDVFFDIKRDSIFLSLSYLPIIQVYNRNAELINTIKLKEKEIKNFYNNNLNTNNVIKNGMRVLRGWMAEANLEDNKLYSYYPELRGILVFDLHGNLVEKILFKDENSLKSLKYFITIIDEKFVFLDIMDAQIKIYNLETPN